MEYLGADSFISVKMERVGVRGMISLCVTFEVAAMSFFRNVVPYVNCSQV